MPMGGVFFRLAEPAPRVGQLGWDAGFWHYVHWGLCIGRVVMYVVPPIAEHMCQGSAARVRWSLS